LSLDNTYGLGEQFNSSNAFRKGTPCKRCGGHIKLLKVRLGVITVKIMSKQLEAMPLKGSGRKTLLLLDTTN
jgi:hypothetical protein